MDTTTTPLPGFVYVSELLRTWETAILLFLSASNTNLTLHISPYLRESGPVAFPSDDPGDLKQQVREFVRFIVFLRYLKRSKNQNIPDILPSNFVITLTHFIGPFTIEYIRGIESPRGVEINIRNGGIDVECNFANDTTIATTPLLNDVARAITVEPSTYSAYREPAIQLKFPGASSVSNVGDMNTPSTPAGSLADFVNWYEYLKIKPHGEGIVYFVAHSGTMTTFVNQIIMSNQPPSGAFKSAYDQAVKTNTWSLFFKPNATGAIFKGFRHAYSCDNRYMHKGPHTIGTRLGETGEYTNLSLWGILSTLKFSQQNVRSLINDHEIDSSSLKACRGMDAEPREYLDSTYDNVNELCGKRRERMTINNFSIDYGHCGTSSMFTFTLHKDCIRIIAGQNGPKVVLHLDKPSQKIDARFFESAETSRTYDADTAIKLHSSNIRDSLKKIVLHLLKPSTDAEVDYLIDDLIKATKLFIINKNDPTWEIAFGRLDIGEVGMNELKELPTQSPQAAQLQTQNGGTTKKLQRRRKCAKGYSRRYKKHNSTRKSIQIRRRVRTHR